MIWKNPFAGIFMLASLPFMLAANLLIYLSYCCVFGPVRARIETGNMLILMGTRMSGDDQE